MSLTRTHGYLLAVAAATLWGVSGNFGQFLFQHRGFSSEWLVSTRMLISGVLLLGIAFIREGRGAFSIFMKREDCTELLMFAILGMLGVQFTYFTAIEHSNAATATILQYLGPVIIAVVCALRDRRIPMLHEIIALTFAVIGTFLLVSHGRSDSLSISLKGLFWGLASAVCLAIYTLQPEALLKRQPSATVIGWAMLIGGVAISFFFPPWKFTGIWDTPAFASTAFIVVLGTFIPFFAYMSAVKIVGARTTSLLATAEPLSAALCAVLWLKTSFVAQDWIGALFIVLTMLLLTALNKSCRV
jgi:drug/metabolite transporter (DMT)-like permease